MKKLIQEKNENILGNWTVNVKIGDKIRFLGGLYVTDKSLYFEVQYDTTVEGLFKEIGASAVVSVGHSLLVWEHIANQWKEKGAIEIPKSEIKTVEKQSTWFGLKKLAMLTLKDNTTIVIDYGLLGVSKIIASIQS